MKKEYYLYLDESGDFDEDLRKTYRNQCLVGGFLVADSPVVDASTETLIGNAWSSVVPEDSPLPIYRRIEKAKHATDLVRDGVVTSRQIAELHRKIINGVSKTGDLVIFENYNKASIEDSSRTYLYIMTDGIIQLLQRLAASNVNDEIKLHVVAGYRKDMTMDEEKRTDIPRDEYTSRINELLQLQKIKSPVLNRKRHTVDFSLDYDKSNPALILCDYIYRSGMGV